MLNSKIKRVPNNIRRHLMCLYGCCKLSFVYIKNKLSWEDVLFKLIAKSPCTHVSHVALLVVLSRYFHLRRILT